MQTDHRIEPSSTSHSQRTTACAAIVFVVALGVRLAASRGDLVFDEVWTRQIAADTGSAWNIPLIGTDNNHILNTLVVYLLGLSAPPYAYRLPAALAGTLAVWFGYLLARREGPAAGLIVVTLLGFSHPLIVFCTEARGYAYLACGTLAAWWALEEYLDRPRAWSAATFATAASLGFFAHLTFAFAYAGFSLYSAVRLLPRRGGWRKCLSLHWLPLFSCLFLYVAFVEKMGIGGGVQYPLRQIVLETFSLVAGGPERGAGALVAAGIAALVIVASLADVIWRSPPRGVLYLVAMFLAPAALLMSSWNRYQVVYPRYFLVPMLFAYATVGSAAGRWFIGRREGRWCVSLLLAGFVTCNLVPVMRLIGSGRGQYSAAVRWMAEHSEGPLVTLASDHDFRNPLMVAYYAGRESRAFAERGSQLVYSSRERFPTEGTEWFLLHSFGGDPPHSPEFTTPGGVHYVLERVFPCDSLSGWTWWLYRRTNQSK